MELNTKRVIMYIVVQETFKESYNQEHIPILRNYQKDRE